MSGQRRVERRNLYCSRMNTAPALAIAHLIFSGVGSLGDLERRCLSCGRSAGIKQKVKTQTYTKKTHLPLSAPFTPLQKVKLTSHVKPSFKRGGFGRWLPPPESAGPRQPPAGWVGSPNSVPQVARSGGGRCHATCWNLNSSLQSSREITVKKPKNASSEPCLKNDRCFGVG